VVLEARNGCGETALNSAAVAAALAQNARVTMLVLSRTVQEVRQNIASWQGLHTGVWAAVVVGRRAPCEHDAVRHLPPAALNDRCGSTCAAGSCPDAASAGAAVGRHDIEDCRSCSSARQGNACLDFGAKQVMSCTQMFVLQP
jgi:hypothetical protein